MSDLTAEQLQEVLRYAARELSNVAETLDEIMLPSAAQHFRDAAARIDRVRFGEEPYSVFFYDP